MLLLRRVQVLGYRSIADASFDLQEDMSVLTGENDGGKTATLCALEVLLAGRQLDQDDICRGHTGAATVLGEFSHEDDPLREHSVLVRAVGDGVSAVRREVMLRTHTVIGASPSALPLNDLKSRMEEAGVPSPGGAAKQPYVDACMAWLEGRDDLEFCDEWVPASRDLLDSLPALTPYRSSSVADPESHIRTLVSQEVRRLISDDVFAAPLAEVEAKLTKDVQPSLDDLRAKIREYCPDLEDIEVDARCDFTKPTVVVTLVLRKNNQDVLLDRSGEGRRRRITLAIHEAGLVALSGTEPSRCEVITYDEPDTHLDYASQRQLFGILEHQSLLPHVQVVVATHSLNFIDKVPLQSLVHYRVDPASQHTKVEVLKSDILGDEMEFLAGICAGLGLRNSVLLDERVFLMVEGATEEAALPGLFRVVTGRSLLSSGVTMFDSKGSHPLRQIARVLKNEWGRTVVALMDEDQRVQSAQWIADTGFTEGVDLFFVGTKELEDAISDQVWTQVLNASFPPKDGGAAWTAAELAALRSDAKFSQALCNKVKARCTDHGISKPDLGIALSRQLTDKADIPPKITTCLETVYKAAS